MDIPLARFRNHHKDEIARIRAILALWYSTPTSTSAQNCQTESNLDHTPYQRHSPCTVTAHIGILRCVWTASYELDHRHTRHISKGICECPVGKFLFAIRSCDKKLVAELRTVLLVDLRLCGVSCSYFLLYCLVFAHVSLKQSVVVLGHDMLFLCSIARSPQP